MNISSGDILYTVGEKAQALYVVEEGELQLLITKKGINKVVESLIPGTMVGELELFSGHPRICTLVAYSDSVVWMLSKKSFEQLSKENPALALQFVTKVAISFDAVRFYNCVHHWSQLG